MRRRQKRHINRELAAIASLKDSDIDTSDIPEIADWGQAVVGRVYRSEKSAASRPANTGTGFTPRHLPNPDVRGLEGDVLSEMTERTPRFAEAALAQSTSQELILRCVQGQTSAWEEFIRRYNRLIATVVVRISRQWGDTSSELTDDLIQDVYLKLADKNFELLRKFEPRHENSILGFLKIVASNIVYDHFRATRPLKIGGGEPLLRVDTAGSVDTVAQAERDVLLEEVNRLLETRASERDRAIFWLHYRQGFTTTEIATIPEVNLTVKGVESILHRLTQLLKRKLIQAPAEFQAQQGAVTLPLTDLSEQAIEQVLSRARLSPKKAP